MFDCVKSMEVIEQLHKNNYLIEDDLSSNRMICAIYFSSHGVYYPETIENFNATIVEKNYFEWYGTRVPNCKKHIFVRDICKQFYVEGINTKINSIDSLIDFLKEKTKGFETICVGSSSGGYVAALIGSIMNSTIIFCYSGKFSLKDDFAYMTKEKLLFHENQYSYSKYYNSVEYINRGESPIIYVFPKF